MRDFSKVSPTLWRSRKFKALRTERAKLVYMYLLTCPHGNAAGCFDLPPQYAAADLDIKETEYLKALDELHAVDLVRFDATDETLLIVNWEAFNEPTNSKHAMGILNQLQQASSPKMKLAALEAFTKAFDAKGFGSSETISKAIDSLSKDYREAISRVSPLEETRQEETEMERETGKVAPLALVPFDECVDLVDRWNEMASELGLAQVQSFTAERRKALSARLVECGGPEGFKFAMGKIRASPFLRGANDRGWKADFDFLLQKKSFTKLMEGSYDDRKPAGGISKSDPSGIQDAIAELRDSA